MKKREEKKREERILRRLEQKNQIIIIALSIIHNTQSIKLWRIALSHSSLWSLGFTYENI